MEDALPGYVDINPYRKPVKRGLTYVGLALLLLITAGVVYLALSRT